MDRGDRLATGLAAGVLVVRIGAHRPGSVQRRDRRDVFELVGTHRAQQRSHRATIELEDAQCVSTLQQLEGRRVVQRQVLQHDLHPAIALDVVQRVVDDRQVAQTQEVHLHQAQRLRARVVELGDDGAVLLALHDRDHIGERHRTHDHAAGMHPPLSLQALNALRGVHDLTDLGVGIVQFAELAALGVAVVLGVEQFLQRHVLAHHRRGHGLGDALTHRKGLVEHAGRVLDRLLRLDSAVGDDLGDVILAVLLGHIVEDLTPPALVEVDVEVWQRGPFRVEEAFEQQAVGQRIEVGDAHRISDDRPGTRTTAGSDPNVVALGPADVVGDHQVVARVTLGQNDAHLVVGAFPDMAGQRVAEPVSQAFLRLVPEPGLLGVAVGHVEDRHEGAVALVETGLTAFGDLECRVTCLGQIAEQRPHLVGRPQVVARAVELEAVGAVQAGAGGDAQQDVLRLRVLGVHVVQVVGGDQRGTDLLGQSQQVTAHPGLDRQPMVHQFDVEVLSAEDRLELGGRGDRFVEQPEPQVRLNLTRRTAGGGDESVVVLVQQFAVGPRLVEVALQAGAGRQSEQIVHALAGLAPQRHVGVGALGGHVVAGAVPELDALALPSRGAGGEVRLQPDDRLQLVLLGGLVELVSAEHIAVVGDAKRRHALLARRLHQVIHPGRAIQHREVGVVVQMDEPPRHRDLPTLPDATRRDLHHHTWGPRSLEPATPGSFALMLAISAVSLSPTNPLEGLEIADRPEPVPHDDWVPIRMRATTLNHHDLWSLKGVGLRDEQLPRILGCDGAGVDPQGNEVIIAPVITRPGWRLDETLDPKRSLFSEVVDGTFAELVLVPRANLVPKPAGWSWETAAVASLTWLTAYRMLFTQSGLRPGELVLVQGAGGGVNSACVQLARAVGVRVWVTSRDAGRRDRALELGAEQVFESGARLPEKVDAVIDNVGAATWSHSINVLRPGGILVTCGATSGDAPTRAELSKIFFRELRIQGSTAGTRSELQSVVALAQAAGIQPLIDTVLPLADARRGFARLAAGEVFGKIVFTS